MSRLRKPRELAAALRRQSMFSRTRQWRRILTDAADMLDDLAYQQEKFADEDELRENSGSKP